MCWSDLCESGAKGIGMLRPHTTSGAWGSCGFERTSDGRSRVGERVNTFNSSRECDLHSASRKSNTDCPD